MPVFNCELYIREAIESILKQTFSNFEFLIFDDGSTDNTRNIIESYSDKRIKLIINEHNIGLTASLNKGIEIAKGDYIARMDGDDISLLKRLAKQIEYLEKNQQIGICGTWISTFGFEKKTIVKYQTNSKILKIQPLFSSPLAHPSIMIRKKFIEKLSLKYDTKYSIAQDYDLWSKCVFYFDIGVVDTVLLKYRTFNPSSRKAYTERQTNETKQIYISILSKLSISPSEEELQIHNNIGFKNRIHSKKELQKCLDWLILLKQKCLESNLYNEKYLLIILQKYWFSICYSSTSLGFHSLKKYLQIKFSPHNATPLSYKFKFLIKIIIQK